MLKHLITFFCLTMLTACVTQTSPEKLMPSVQYRQSISVHTHKSAYLYWKTGLQLTAIEPSAANYNGDPIAALIGSAIDAQLRKNNPGRYTYTYGGAQQAVFITSMKNALLQNGVFNKVNLITTDKSLNPNEVVIILNFKTTRVAGPEQQYAISLTVEMTIKSPDKKTFIRTYSVHNSPNENVWTGRSFEMQQTEVSEKMLNHLMSGISEWYHNP